MIWLIIACTLETQTIEMEQNRLKSPAILSWEWACDSELDQWTISITTDGWTSNGHVWISDTLETEKHYIQSIGAPADGSSDHLEITLDVAADWRDAQAGTSTRFRCSQEEDLHFLSTVLHPETGGITDCVKSGSLDWSAIEGAPLCEDTID